MEHETLTGTLNELLLDWDHLGVQTFGDAALARDLLGLFAEQCRRLMPGIGDAALDARDRADLAHALKGSALGIGAVRVAGQASEAERLLRIAEPAAARPVRALAEAVEATLAAIGEQDRAPPEPRT